MSTPTHAWEKTLTDLEDELDRHEAAVRTGEARMVPQWDPPADLGPLPVGLADRVTHLTQRIGLLSTFVQYHLQAIESDLAHLERQGGAAAPRSGVALYLDASV